MRQGKWILVRRCHPQVRILLELDGLQLMGEKEAPTSESKARQIRRSIGAKERNPVFDLTYELLG